MAKENVEIAPKTEIGKNPIELVRKTTEFLYARPTVEKFAIGSHGIHKATHGLEDDGVNEGDDGSTDEGHDHVVNDTRGTTPGVLVWIALKLPAFFTALYFSSVFIPVALAGITAGTITVGLAASAAAAALGTAVFGYYALLRPILWMMHIVN